MSNPFISFLALARVETVSTEHYLPVFNQMAAPMGMSGQDLGAQPEKTSSGDATIISVGPLKFVVMYIDKPVPEGTFDQATRISIRWRDANAALAGHQAHVIVGAMEKAPDTGTALSQAVIVTMLAASIGSCLPTIGVYWAAGDTVTRFDHFLASAKDLGRKQLPIPTWIQMQILDGPRTDDGRQRLALVTKGLAPFVGREIEFQPIALAPEVIASRVIGTAQYLITNGPILKHEDTLGISEDERIRVRYADQGHVPGIPVMKLTLEQLNDEFYAQ